MVSRQIKMALGTLFRSALILFLFTFVVQAATLVIARPNFGVPEFVQPGGVFRVEIKAAVGLSTTGWTASLENDLRSWPAVVEKAEYGQYVDNNIGVGYQLTIRAPLDISPEIQKLKISHISAGTNTNVNAVSVLTCIDTSFYIIHYADPQPQGWEPDNAASGMCKQHGSMRELLWHAPAIQLAHPRILFGTGDELDNQLSQPATYLEYKKRMCGMGTAILSTRGNNDIGDELFWRSTFGVETFSIRMGSFYIFQRSVRSNPFQPWLEKELKASFADPTIKFRLMGQHWTDLFYNGVNSGHPNMMIVGHGHINRVDQTKPFPSYMTEAAFKYGAGAYYNFSKTGTGWSCTSISNKWFHLMSGGSTANLSCVYKVPNDGDHGANSVVITNKIGVNFWDGRIRFLVPFSNDKYTVIGGTRLAQYDYNGGKNCAVLVRVNIPASGTVTVSIVGPYVGPVVGAIHGPKQIPYKTLDITPYEDGQLRIMVGTPGAYSIKLIAVNGSIVKTAQNISLSTGVNIFSLPGVSKGSYIGIIEGAGLKKMTKVILR